jgi:hypothetical protein
MSKYAKWFIVAAGAVVFLGLALGAFLLGWFVVRPAVAGTSTPWVGPGMMGRAVGPDSQVDWSTQDVPPNGCGGNGGLACPNGGASEYGVPPSNACLYGETSGCGESVPGTGAPLTLDQAQAAVERYVAAYGNSDLAVHEVMEFERNFYAIIEEKSTGIGAFEVLVDRWSGVVRPEPGPNMMWNARYGMMGGRGMMGDRYAGGTGAMLISTEDARARAQTWLDQNMPGVEARPDDVDPFYGYYTLHVWKDGQVYGMLSVNGQTGQIWYHSWHGDFVSMLEEEGD